MSWAASVAFRLSVAAHRRDGQGVTRERTVAELKALDVGYGYTADGELTFPFRGKFIGAMPTWAEVIVAFPGKQFLVNVKSNDPGEGALIAAYAETRGFDLSNLAFYGGDGPIAVLRERWPQVRTMSRATLKACAWRYLLLGWSGYVPEPCRHSILFVPVNWQRALWGWPEQFVRRMREAGTDVAIIGPVAIGRTDAGTTAIDRPEELDLIAAEYGELIATDRIDTMGVRVRR